MRKIFFCFISLISFFAGQAQVNDFKEKINNKSYDPSAFMWYAEPASKWEEALPIGNGRLGAMVFGKYKEERIQLNEDTYWSGGPYSTVVKDGYKVLPEIQKDVLVLENIPQKKDKEFDISMQKLADNGCEKVRDVID